MSKIISQYDVIKKFEHFQDFHPDDSIGVNMNSLERCIYLHGRRTRIDRHLCAAINENGEVIPLDLDNLTIAAKPKYSNDFVGYVNIGEECAKISAKSPYNYTHSLIFAFVCENVALFVLLTNPVAANAGLSGMSIDIGIKDDSINNYNKVMESISAVASLLKLTALRNLENGSAFTGFFEPLPVLPCKVEDEITRLTQDEEYYDYSDNEEVDYYV